MASFWDLSDGNNAAESKATEFDAGGGPMEPIPGGSSVLAYIVEAKWDSKDNANYISLKWQVAQPEGVKNRIVFQKLWVTDDDPGAADASKAAKKRDKARRMLAAIDANAGGKLTKVSAIPTDDDLALHLTNKPMVVRVMLWEVEDRATGDAIRGNWISAVAPKTSELFLAEAAPAARQTGARPTTATSVFEDEIPF